MDKKIKILHAVGGLGAGGVETWLFNLLGQINLNEYQMDFITFSDKKGVYDHLVIALGCKVYYYPKTKNIFKIAKYYINTVKQNGYDIVHCHRHLLCAIFFTFNKFTRAKFIAHSHNTSTDSKLFVFKYFSKVAKAIIKMVPYKLACSEDASIALFDKVETIIDYGINTARFVPQQEKYGELTGLYNFTKNEIIIGHVGRFTEQKNHEFILKVAKILVNKNPRYHFVFIGDGILEGEIRNSITSQQLKDNVHIAGIRTDVSKFMSGLFDVFLFPSLYEGLGIVLLEAQSAGLPSVFSSVIPQRVDVVSELIYRVDLENNAEHWADVILNIDLPGFELRQKYHNAFNDSEYAISKSAAKLTAFYRKIQAIRTQTQSV
jgi:glycosyltransferase involved in cell wall biosynthesis